MLKFISAQRSSYSSQLKSKQMTSSHVNKFMDIKFSISFSLSAIFVETNMKIGLIFYVLLYILTGCSKINSKNKVSIIIHRPDKIFTPTSECDFSWERPNHQPKWNIISFRMLAPLRNINAPPDRVECPSAVPDSADHFLCCLLVFGVCISTLWTFSVHFNNTVIILITAIILITLIVK